MATDAATRDIAGLGHNVQEEEEQQSPSTNQLLRLVPAASGTIVQIPANLLTSLLQSLTGLQSSVAGLQSTVTNQNKEIQGLQQELTIVEGNVQKLQIHSGIEFALFPKLPLEIQRMVWKHSANIPHVISIKRISWRGRYYHAPIVPHGQQLHACRESRQAYSSTKWALEKKLCFQNFDDPLLPKIYLNLSNILWVTSMMDTYNLWEYNDIEALGNEYVSVHSPGKPVELPTIAVPYRYWRLIALEQNLESVMRKLSFVKTTELILVVGGDLHQVPTTFFFAKPHNPPSSMIDNAIFKRAGWAANTTWTMIEAEDPKVIRDLQAERLAARKAHFLSKSNCTLIVTYPY